MRSLLLILILVPFLSAEARLKPEDPVVITDTVNVSDAAKPDIMTTGMSVGFKDADASAVSAAMEKAAAIVKASPVCDFSGYQIYPVYKYTDKNSYFDTYSGVLDFSCEFTDINKYQPVLSSVFDLTSDSRYTVTSRPVRWVLSAKAAADKRTEMKTAAIRQIYRTAKDYGKAIGITCKVKDIELTSDSGPVYRENAYRTMKAAAVSEPEQTDVSLNFSAKYRLVCR